MLSCAERNSLLRQCWQQGRWADGFGTIVRPMRSSLYRIRRQMMHRRSNAVRPVEEVLNAPVFSDFIHPAFSERFPDPTIVPFAKSLAGDVEKMMQGSYPLAGGAFRDVRPAGLDQLEDQEDWHAYHRLYWAVRLSQAACAQVPGAENLLVAEISDWLNNPWGEDRMILHPYTVSERMASLTEVLFWSGTSKSSKLLGLTSLLKSRIWQDARSLQKRIEYALGIHNHLLNNARALMLAAAVLPECKEADEWSAQAFQIWENVGPKLILEDGTFGEQSSHYHVLLCRTALEYWVLSAEFGREIEPSLKDRIRKMFVLANDLVRADGSQPRFGDVSPDHGADDLRGLMAAVHVLGILDQSPADRCCTPLTFYYCGKSWADAPDESEIAGTTLSGGRLPRSCDPSFRTSIW